MDRHRTGVTLTVLSLLLLLLHAIEAPNALAGVKYSFTNAGATGQYGPTQSQVTTAYSGTTLAGSVSVTTQGVQQWTVPYSGLYQLVVAGAKGGGSGGSYLAGKGMIETATVALTQNTVLLIVVGQKGVDGTATTYTAGGGGGSFVVNSSGNSPIVIAGGGGGMANGVNALDATSSTTATTGAGTSPGAAGTSGGGGGGGQFGGGGGGLLTDGASKTYVNAVNNGGLAFVNGAVGGNGGNPSGYTGGAQGGFGGGAGSCACSTGGGGGGGGYSGGGGGGGGYGGGGGGGSYVIAGAINNTYGAANLGQGFVTLDFLGTLNSTTTMALSSSPSQPIFRTAVTITANVDQPGTVTFYFQNKKIAGCTKVPVSANQATCIWKASVRGLQQIRAVLTPNNGFNSSESITNVTVLNRTGLRN